VIHKFVQNDIVILNIFIKVSFHLNGYIFVKTTAHELLKMNTSSTVYSVTAGRDV